MYLEMCLVSIKLSLKVKKFCSKLNWFSLTLLWTFFTSFQLIAQQQLITELNQASIPFSIDNHTIDWSFLDSSLKESTLLGLGEETHATKEFFLAKTAIIKYCITQLNYKSIGIEADFAGTHYLNTFLTQGIGSAKQGLYQMGVAAWMTEEMLDLIEWISAYNKDKTLQQKVTFWGFDMRSSFYSIQYLKSYLADKPFSKTTYWNELDSIQKWEKMDAQKLKQWANIEKALIENIQLMKEGQVQTYQDMIMVLQQTIKYLNSRNSYEQLNWRDQYMFENIKLVQERTKQKVILWAHNEHITKNGFHSNYNTMGSQLSNYYKNQYYSVGLFTSDIHVNYYNRYTKTNDSIFIPLDTTINCVNTILNKGQNPSYYLKLVPTNLNYPNLTKFLSQKSISRILIPNPSKNNGYGFDQEYKKTDAMIDRYNAIIFIRHTTGSTRIYSSE